MNALLGWERRRMIIKYTCLWACFLCFSWSAGAQESIDSISVSQENVKMTRQDRSYLDSGHYDQVNYMQIMPKTDTAAYSIVKSKYSSPDFYYEGENPDAENIFERAFNRISHWLSNLFPSASFFNVSETLYKILAGIAILIFLLILYRVLFTGKRLLGPSEEEALAEDSIRFVEQNLLDIELEVFIEKAKQQSDYALAIRYLNLLNIQLLAKKGYILWRPSKTNQELIGELKDVQLRADFKQNVAVFNRVWFSGVKVDAAQYATYSKFFEQFQARWK